MKELYAKISIDDIPELFQAKPFNIYLKLGNAKFVKIINAEDDEFMDILDDYHSRGLQFLYCDSETYQEVLSALESRVDSGFDEAQAATTFEDRYAGLSKAYKGIKGMIVNLGLTPSVQNKAETLVNSLIEESESNTKMEVLLELLQNKGDFITNQGFLTSYLSLAIVNEMDWATEAVKQRLVTASLFQNISLDNDDQAKVYDRNSEEFHALDEFSQEQVLHHPDMSADLVQSPGFGGDEVQKLIKNHHETPLEGHFPGRVGAANIPILDACFIVAGYFATQCLLEKNKDEDFTVMAQTLNESFSVGGFKRAVTSLIKTVSSK